MTQGDGYYAGRSKKKKYTIRGAQRRAVRRAVADAIGALPRDAVVLIGDTHLERDWSVSARLAGYISADRYF